MSSAARLKFDEISYWSEIKLEIIKKYAAAYSQILVVQTKPRLTHIYIDAFAGAGLHLSKATGEFVPGSPLNALHVSPPFCGYHFIDLEPSKTRNLRSIVGDRGNVQIHQGESQKAVASEIVLDIFKTYKNHRGT